MTTPLSINHINNINKPNIMANIKDRTSELLSAIEYIQPQNANGSSFRQRSNNNNILTQPLLNNTINNTPPPPPTSKLSNSQPSQFYQRSSQIARAIHSTTLKLEKLGKLAKRRTLFDDRPVEIIELTDVIKHELTSLNLQIRDLQQLTQSQNNQNRASVHEEQHSQSVVVGLQSSLAKTSQGFANVLEIRTENMRAQKSRHDQFSSSSSSSVPLLMQNDQSLLYNMDSGMPAANSGSSERTEYLSIDMGLDQSMMQQQTNGNVEYMNQRNTALQSIESTMAELGQIFQQLGTLVAQQHEQVQRIDDNVMDVETNVDLARKELMKYWTSVASNRMLFVKVFGIILLFFMLFVVFL